MMQGKTDPATLVVLLIIVAIDGLLGYLFGRKKGQGLAGFFLGLVLSLFGWIIIALLPKNEERTERFEKSQARKETFAYWIASMKRLRLVFLLIQVLVIVIIPLGSVFDAMSPSILKNILTDIFVFGIVIGYFASLIVSGIIASKTGRSVKEFVLLSIVPLIFPLFYSIATRIPNRRIAVPEMGPDYFSFKLVDISDNKGTGIGMDIALQAIKASNEGDTTSAMINFRRALGVPGLDPLLEGYAHAAIGEIMLLEGRNVAGAVAELFQVFDHAEVSYEAAHTASQYLSIILRDCGRYTEGYKFSELNAKTVKRLGHELNPKVKQKVHALALWVTIEGIANEAVRKASSPTDTDTRLIEDEFYKLWESILMETTARKLMNSPNVDTVDTNGLGEDAVEKASAVIMEKYKLSASSMVGIVSRAVNRNKNG